MRTSLDKILDFFLRFLGARRHLDAVVDDVDLKNDGISLLKLRSPCLGSGHH